MKKLSLIFIIVILSAVLIMPAQGKTIKKVAQTGLQFLKVDVSARAAAMGGAYMMIGNDATALFYNPAGIVYMETGFDFFASRTEWIADISYNSGSLVKNLGNLGVVGVSMIYCDYGDNVIGTQVAQNEAGFVETGELDFGAYAVGLAYSRQLTNKFSIGGQVKYATQHLGSNIVEAGGTAKDNKVSGFAVDFGTIFYPGFKSLRVGMSIRNFSPEFKYEEESFELPLTFTISAAMDVLDLLGTEHENSFLLAIDATHPRDYTERLHFGGEFLFMDMLALRAGYKYNYDLEGLTLGAGLNYSLSGLTVKIDYAYSAMEVFDAVNRFSIGIGF